MNKLTITRSLIFFFTFAMSFNMWAACPQGTESGKTIIFLDLNNNPMEIASAQRAACKRGESLLVFPKPGQKSFNIAELDQKLSELKASNTQVNSLLISGHDGGGDFGGEHGAVTKLDLVAVVERHPELKESVTSLLLLGCYTGVKQEIFDWKEVLPKTNLIAGYEGQAPLGDKPAGHSYIEGVLLKEKAINEVKSKRELDQVLKRGIRHISSISAAMYIHPQMCAPGTQHESGFYFRPLKGRNALEDFTTAECTRIRATDAPRVREKYLKYYRGEIEIPRNTNGTELRQIYNFFRENGHCFAEDKNYPTAEKVLFTLFFHGVQKNFAEHFADTLEEDAIKIDELRESVDQKLDGAIIETQTLVDLMDERISRHKPTFGEEMIALGDMRKELGQKLIEKYGEGVMWLDFDHSKLDPEDKEIYNKLAGIRSYHSLLMEMQYTLSMNGNNSDALSTDQLRAVQKIYQDNILNRQAEYRAETKKLLEQVQTPTAEFLEKSSRAEIMRNQFHLEALSTNPFFNQHLGYMRSKSLINDHLVGLNCIPFDWHEYTSDSSAARPECPYDESRAGAGGGAGYEGNDEEEAGYYNE